MGIFSEKYFFVHCDSISVAVLTDAQYGKKLERVSASNIFLANGILKDYQKIVLYVPFMKRVLKRMKENAVSKLNSFYAQELISGVQFCRVPNNDPDKILTHRISWFLFID